MLLLFATNAAADGSCEEESAGLVEIKKELLQKPFSLVRTKRTLENNVYNRYICQAYMVGTYIISRCSKRRGERPGSKKMQSFYTSTGCSSSVQLSSVLRFTHE